MTGSAGSANLGLDFDVLARVSTNYVAWFWYRCFGPPVEPFTYVDSVHEEVNRNIDITDVFVLNNMVLCTNYTYWHVIFYSILSFLWLLYLIHIVLLWYNIAETMPSSVWSLLVSIHLSELMILPDATRLRKGDLPHERIRLHLLICSECFKGSPAGATEDVDSLVVLCKPI